MVFFLKKKKKIWNLRSQGPDLKYFVFCNILLYTISPIFVEVCGKKFYFMGF